MDCPSLQTLAELLVGEDVGADVRRHVDTCETCKRRLATLSKTTLAPKGPSGSLETAATQQGEVPPARHSMRLMHRGEGIGRYVISELLGAGGMGVVYAAQDPQLDRRVAVKVLRAGFARNITGARQFLIDEAKAMAKLSHPNVVTVHDVGVLEDQVFLAMELVEGQTLRELMRGKPAMRDALRVLIEAGRGLAAAHKAGLVHRDFKPENVLIGRDGRVCVSDFGVARSADASNDDVAGTPMYMAPEAHEGVIDPRSDQYSFCVTLLELLIGEPPGLEPRRHVDRAPLPMRRILQRGLAAAPADRFASMDVLLAELAPRRRAGWIVAGAGGLALAAVVGAVVLMPRREEPCTNADAELAPVWNPDAAAAIDRAFGGGDRVARVIASLGRWEARWTSAHRRVCRATRVDGSQSVELLDLRMACLRGRAVAVGALVAQLRQGDKAALAFAPSSIPSAGDLSLCDGDRDALRSLAVLRDPARAEQALALRSELAAVEADHWSGHAHAVVGRAESLAKRADAAKLALVAAPARFYEGFAKGQLGEKDAAVALLRAAVLDADRAGDDELRLRAQVTLAQVLAVSGKVDAADEAVAAAEATVARLGNRPELVAGIDGQKAKAMFVRGRYEEALALAQRSVEGWQRAKRESDPGALTAQLAVGMNLEALGRRAEAKQTYEAALADFERRFGEDSPHSASVRAYLASLALQEGKVDSARAGFERAIQILDDALGADAVATSVWRGQLATIEAGAGHLDKARMQLQMALVLVVAPGAHAERASLYASLGDIERGANNAEAALAAYERAVTELEAQFGAQHPALVEFLARRAETHRMLKQYDAAARDFERAIAISRTGKLAEIDQLDYYLAVNAREAGDTKGARAAFEQCLADKAATSQVLLTAQCEWELAEVIVGAERARAVTLMRHARAVFAEAADAEAVQELDAWLAAHAR